MPRFTRPSGQIPRARALRRDASATERKVWLVLNRSQLGLPFRRQYPAGPYFLDYVCLPLRLAVEIDGELHDAAYDRRRDAYLGALGFRVLRIQAGDVDESLEGVSDTIREAMRARWYELGLGEGFPSGPPRSSV